MIIVKLMGGLGNQMFQYALGRQLAHTRRTALKLDLSWFAGQELRAYQLGGWKITAPAASPEEVERLTRSQRGGLTGRLIRALQRRLPYYARRVIQERGFAYDPHILLAPRQAYLAGYWQSEQYFLPVAPRLRAEFNLKAPPSKGCQTWSERIRRQPSISLHVRRGDYVSRKAHTHGACSLEYYAEAIAYLRRRVPKARLFVFSDELAWARENLGGYPGCEFVALEGNQRDVEEMHLMSECQHHIIANSSFSWWGAWLGTHPEQIVIAPKKWFNNETLSSDDLVPERWIRL